MKKAAKKQKASSRIKTLKLLKAGQLRKNAHANARTRRQQGRRDAKSQRG